MNNLAVAQRDAEALLNVDFTHTHLLTRVDRYTLAIPIANVISIHEAPVIFPAPCAQDGIMGAVRFQGNAVPVFDLRRSFRLQSRPVQHSDRLVLLDTGTRIMAVFVEAVLEFAILQADVTSTIDGMFGNSAVNAQIISGIACAPELCAIIDPAGLVHPDEWDDEMVETVFEQPLDAADPFWARTAALAEIPKQAQATGIEAAIFKIATQRYGVPLATIVEFFTDASHSPIPVRASIAASLLNRRGEALMLFDPRPILGLPAAPLPERVDGIVLNGDRCKLAFAVDTLEGLGLLPHSDASVKPGRCCLSVHPSDRGAVLLLDVPAFLQSAQAAFAARPASSVTANA